MAYSNTISIIIAAKDEASKVLDAAAGNVKSTSTAMGEFGKSANTVGTSLSKYLTLPIAGLGIAAVKMAADFQSSMTRLVTSAGESESNLQMVSAGVLQISRDTGTSSTALAQAMYVIESGGQHGAAGLEVLKAAAQGAKTENADLSTVADAVTSALTDYHLTAASAADVTSKLVAATGQGKTTFQELAGAMPDILPVASAAHIALSDILGDLASMTMHGISAQQAAQNMADAIRHLQSPTMTMSKELAALGINSTELSQNLGQKGLSGTIQEISQAIQDRMGPGTTAVILNMEDALKGLPQSVQDISQQVINGTATWADWNKATKDLTVTQRSQAQAFATLYNGMHTIGTEQMTGAQVMQTYAGAMNKAMGDSAGLNVALMLTGENTQNTTNAINAVAGATADASGNVKGWGDIQQTFNFHLQQFEAALHTSAITIGNDLLPAATSFITHLSSLVDKFDQLSPAQRHFIEDAAGIVAVIGPSILIVGRFATALDNIVTVSTKASQALGLIKTTKLVEEAAKGSAALGRTVGLAGAAEDAGAALAGSGGLLAVLGPLALGIGAIAITGGAAYLAYKYFADTTKQHAADINTTILPAVTSFDKLASDLGVTLKGTSSNVDLLTLAQTTQANAASMVTAAQDKLKASQDAYKQDQQDLTQKTTDYKNAQALAQQMLDQFGANSPQYQNAALQVRDAYDKLAQKLNDTAGNELNVMINGNNLHDAEMVWKGATYDLGNMQQYLNDRLSGGVGVIARFGPTASLQVGAIDMLQQHISGVVKSWSSLVVNIQQQNPILNNSLQGLGSTIDRIQNQSDTLNSSLGAADSSAISLQGHMPTLQGGSGALQGGTRALGSNYAPGGLTLVGERGPELVSMPKGSKIYNDKETSKMMTGGQQTTNVLSGTFNFNNKESVDSFFDRLDKTQRLARLGAAA